MEAMLQGGTLDQFTEKLRSLRKQAIRISPILYEELPYDPLGQQYDEEQASEQIRTLYERAKLVFERFGVLTGAKAVGELYERRSNDLLAIIDEPPWLAGDYMATQALVELLDNYLYAYSSNETELEQHSLAYLRLRELLQNIESWFTIYPEYPQSETDLQKIVDAVLVCSFPKLLSKPPISTPMKPYIPDTGIPEARTLIEYKYITKKAQVKTTVDQISADMIGYRHPDWNRIVYVIYETGHFSTLEKWKDQLRDFKHVDVVLVKGR